MIPDTSAQREHDGRGCDDGAVAKVCPRCGAGLICRAADPAHCDCRRVVLSAETLQALRTRFNGCLCPACLSALGASPVGAPGGTPAGAGGA